MSREDGAFMEPQRAQTVAIGGKCRSRESRQNKRNPGCHRLPPVALRRSMGLLAYLCLGCNLRDHGFHHRDPLRLLSKIRCQRNEHCSSLNVPSEDWTALRPSSTPSVPDADPDIESMASTCGRRSTYAFAVKRDATRSSASSTKDTSRPPRLSGRGSVRS